MNRENFENHNEEKVFSELLYELKLLELAKEDLESGKWTPKDIDIISAMRFVEDSIESRQGQISRMRDDIEEGRRPAIAREAENIAERLPEEYLRRWVLDEIQESEL